MPSSDTELSSARANEWLPLIRPRVQFELVKLEARLQGRNESEDLPVVYRPFGQELAVTVVRDQAEDWVAITPSDLESLEIDFEHALNRALTNFKAYWEYAEADDRFERIDQAYWSAKPHDDLESCLHMLFPQTIGQIEVTGQTIAFVPEANALWLADSNDADLIAKLTSECVKAHRAAGENALCPIPLELQGNRWAPLRVRDTHPAADAVREARRAQSVSNYERQKEVLTTNSVGESPDPVDLTQAQLRMSDGRTAGCVVTCWREGCNVLLPRADFVVLQRGMVHQGNVSQQTPAQNLIVSWQDLIDVLGQRIRSQELFPDRFLARQFPLPSEWSVLQRAALEPYRAIGFPLGSQTSSTSVTANNVASAKGSAGSVPVGSSDRSSVGWWLIGGAIACIGTIGLCAVFIIGYLMLSTRTETDRVAQAPPAETRNLQPLDRVRDMSDTRIPILDIRPNDDTDERLPPEPEEFLTCDVEIPTIQIEPRSLTSQSVGNFDSGTPFESRAPEGGLLVGFQLGKTDSWGGSIAGFRPIYQVGSQYVNGAWCGAPHVTEAASVLAKPGYAVSAVSVHCGLVINSFQVEFQEVDENGRLDPTTRYVTQAFGGGTIGSSRLETNRGIVTGLSGTFGDELVSLTWETGITMPKPDEAIARFEPAETRSTETIGDPQYDRYADDAPDGGLLVGMRVFTGDRWGGVVQGLQPIYQVEDRYVLGTHLGPQGGTAEEIIARPGYAVGGINTREGLVQNCIQLVFYRLNDGALDNTDDYRSNWIGINSGESNTIDTVSDPIVGIRMTAKVDIHSLTLIRGEKE